MVEARMDLMGIQSAVAQFVSNWKNMSKDLDRVYTLSLEPWNRQEANEDGIQRHNED